jgi:hypothetical protein
MPWGSDQSGHDLIIRERKSTWDAAHLAVYLTRGVKYDHIKNYSQKSGHARQGVALWGGWEFVRTSKSYKSPTKRMSATDPDSPQVSATPSEYTPLVLKGGDELPASRDERLSWIMPGELPNGQTHMYRPSTMCQSFETTTVKGRRSSLG